MSVENQKCEICGCSHNIEKHHLVPQSKCHSTKYSKKLKNDESNFLWICKNCHDTLHSYFTNNELRDLYSTKESLLMNEKFAKYVKWRIKHIDYDFKSSKMSNDVKRRR